MSDQSTGGSHLVADTIDGVRWLRLNRPDKLNALSAEMRVRLIEELTAADEDPRVRCVVLSGTGRAFCAGGDVGDGMGSRTAEATAFRMFGSARLINQFGAMTKPTIAAVNGLAAGAGASIAMLCDLAYLSDSAWLSFVFVDRGLVPDFSATYFLPRVVGVARARELAMTARRVTPAEAVGYGLAVDHFPDETFEQQVQERAVALGAGNVTTMSLIRRMINHSHDVDFRTALEREALAQGVAASTDEHHEAVAAFKARRAAVAR